MATKATPKTTKKAPAKKPAPKKETAPKEAKAPATTEYQVLVREDGETLLDDLVKLVAPEFVLSNPLVMKAVEKGKGGDIRVRVYDDNTREKLHDQIAR